MPTQQKENRRRQIPGEHTPATKDAEELAQIFAPLWAGKYQPQSIDIYPVETKTGALEIRLHTVNIPNGEKVGPGRCVEIAEEIVGHCQRDCNTKREKKPKRYQINVIDGARGGISSPCAAPSITLTPRGAAPAIALAIGEEGETEPVTAQSMMSLFLRKQELDQAGKKDQGQFVVDVLGGGTTLLLQAAKDAREDNRELTKLVIALVKDARDDHARAADRQVDMEALKIDAEERRAQRRKEDRSGQWLDGLVNAAITGFGELLPGLSKVAVAIATGQPIPPVQDLLPPREQPKLPAAPTTTEAKPPTNGDAPMPAIPKERELILEFFTGCKKVGIAEALFGKDNDDGTPLAEGVFTRPQVALLGAVINGAPVETLDAILPDSGHGDALTFGQIMRARKILPKNLADLVTQVIDLRNAAHA